MDRNEWLLARKRGIGGSDIAAILGISPFRTPLDVYQDKTSDILESKVQNSAMRFGNILEPVIRQHYVEQTGEQLEEVPPLIVKDFMIASLDGMTKSGKILEIKTARSDKEWGEPGSSDIPLSYTAQVQHYMMVTGCKLADIAVLIGGSDFRIYTLFENKELQGMLYKKELEFWQKVQSRTPPDATTEMDVSILYPKSLKNSIEANERVIEKIRHLTSLNKDSKQLDERISEVKFELKSYIQDHDGITLNGNPLITYKNSKDKESINFEAVVGDLSLKYGEEVSGLIKVHTRTVEGSRRFLIK